MDQTINGLVSHLYSSKWITNTVNNIGKNLNKDQKQDIEQYIYLYILEHPSYFIRNNKLKPLTEITYYLTAAIQNQYKDTFRNSYREIVNTDLIYKMANYK